MKERPSLSKSALFLSPCLAWTSSKAKWYDDRFTDNTKRDIGIGFHTAIDKWLKEHQKENKK